MNREQLDELRELKSQETKLHVSIKRQQKLHRNSQWLEAQVEKRGILIEKMKPLRDQMLSELANSDDSLMISYVRCFYSGMSASEIADLFGYRNGGAVILQKVKKAESQVTNSEQ